MKDSGGAGGAGGRTSRSGGRGSRRGGAADDSGARSGPASLVCELCGGAVLDRHCKIVCLNCGYQRDCSDP